jgi:hypothetical protein
MTSSSSASVPVVKNEPAAVVSRVVLKSAYGQVGFHKKLHVARFVGFSESEQFTPNRLATTNALEMRRAEPAAVVERVVNARKARARYQVSEVSKATPLVVNANDESERRHRKLVLSAQPRPDTKGKKQSFDGQLEAGQRSSYVVFVSRSQGEFSVMPVTDWYNFKKRSLSMQDKAAVSIDAIEKHIKSQRRTSRLLMPKNSLLGRDLEGTDEPMDPARYESRHAPRFEEEFIAADPDADVNAAVSDDEGDGAGLARPDDERQAVGELKVAGIVVDEPAATDDKLNDTGKRIRKLLERDNNDESDDDDDDDDEDDEHEDEEDDDADDDADDDDDIDDKVDGKLSGRKRKGAPAARVPYDLAHGKRIRQSGLPVLPPSVVSESEMMRVLRESGVLQLPELLGAFRLLLKDSEANKNAFKMLVRKLTDDGEIVFEADTDGKSYCHVTYR